MKKEETSCRETEDSNNDETECHIKFVSNTTFKVTTFL